MFMNSDKKNRLVWDAVPTVFSVPNPPKLVTLKRKCPFPRVAPANKRQAPENTVGSGNTGVLGTAAGHDTDTAGPAAVALSTLDNVVPATPAVTNASASSGMHI